jgi:V8-like Glu-specific endopeptidase
MVHFTSTAAAAILAFTTGAQASPITLDDTVGFDSHYEGNVHTIAARDEPIIPEYRSFPVEHFSDDTSAVAMGYTPEDSNLRKIEKMAKRFIFGSADDREHWNVAEFPFHSVGRLYWSSGVLCSGALVGPRHVLTAKHCIPDEPVAGDFSPGYDDGERFGNAQIEVVLSSEGQEAGSPCETKGDWAVLVLDQNLGDQLGYFGVKSPDENRLDKPDFQHMGYPGDKGGSKPYRVDDTTVNSSEETFSCDSSGPIFTDADTSGGQSGGPIWEMDENQDRWIWGALSIGVSWGEGLGHSGFASGAQMVDAVNQLREEFS